MDERDANLPAHREPEGKSVPQKAGSTMPLGRRSKAFVGFLAVLIRLANRSTNDLTYSILTDGFFKCKGLPRPEATLKSHGIQCQD
jgi:hypothetical protein